VNSYAHNRPTCSETWPPCSGLATRALAGQVQRPSLDSRTWWCFGRGRVCDRDLNVYANDECCDRWTRDLCRDRILGLHRASSLPRGPPSKEAVVRYSTVEYTHSMRADGTAARTDKPPAASHRRTADYINTRHDIGMDIFVVAIKTMASPRLLLLGIESFEAYYMPRESSLILAQHSFGTLLTLNIKYYTSHSINSPNSADVPLSNKRTIWMNCSIVYSFN